MASKATFLCDSDLTPIQVPNAWNPGVTPQPTDRPVYLKHPCWHDWLAKNGFREAFGIYAGTLNRSGEWRGIAPADYAAGKRGVGSNAGDIAIDPADTQAAIEAVARLAMRPNTYGGSNVWEMPLWFDIELSSTQLSLWSDEATRLAHLANQAKMLGLARDVYRGRIWWYAGNAPYVIDGPMTGPNRDIVWDWDGGKFDPIMKVVSDAMLCFYNWNEPALNPELFYRDVDDATARLERHYPWANRVAVVSPQYLINWNAKLTVVGKTVPPHLFAKQIEYLIDRNYREILVWYNPLDPTMKFDLTNSQLVQCFQACKQFMFDPTPEVAAAPADVTTTMANQP